MTKKKGRPKKIKEQKPESPAEVPQEPKTPPISEPTVPQTEQKTSVAQRVLNKAEQMREHLERQPKVMFMIPKLPTEPANATDQVCLNGYKMEFPKGEIVEMPEQVAEIFAAKYRAQSQMIAASLASGKTTISKQSVGESL